MPAGFSNDPFAAAGGLRETMNNDND